jgi:hypothetical protein
MADDLRVGVERLIAEWRKDAADLREATGGEWIEPGVVEQCANNLEELLTSTGETAAPESK